MTNHDDKIINKKELPEEGPTQVIKYDVEIKINGKEYRKGFNIEPGQDIHGHIERWLHNIR